MPAIQIDQLRVQSANLAGKFGSPEEFISGFQSILEAYTDLTYKPSAARATSTRLKTFRTPAPVIRQVERDLKLQMTVFPQETYLNLANALRQVPILEYQLIAIFILGRAPLDPPEPVLSILFDWLEASQDPQIRESLLTTGLERYRREKPDIWLEWIRTTIKSDQGKKASMALHALIPALEDRQFSEIPTIFSFFYPFLTADHPELEPEIYQVLRGLLRRSPVETLYLAQEVLSRQDSSKTTTARVIRKLLPEFPPDAQNTLKKCLFQGER